MILLVRLINNKQFESLAEFLRTEGAESRSFWLISLADGAEMGLFYRRKTSTAGNISANLC